MDSSSELCRVIQERNRAIDQRDKLIVLCQNALRDGIKWSFRAKVQAIIFEINREQDEMDKRLASELQLTINQTENRLKKWKH